ncbi:hypothetical protein D3C84_607990 [compost metagenome]
MSKSSCQTRAGFDQHLVDVTLGQFNQQLMQIDLTVITRHDQTLGAMRVLLFDRDTGGDQCRASLEERCIQRHPQAPVDQHAQRRSAHGQRGLLGIQTQLVGAHGQTRAIGQHGVGAGQHHGGLSAQTLNGRTCGRAGDPLALAAFHGCPTIETHSQLDPHERQAVLHAFQKTLIELARLGFEHAAFGSNAGIGQALQTTSGNLRVRIAHRCHHPGNPGIHQCFGTRRRAAMVAARFQRHISGRAPGQLTGGAQGVDFGVRFAGTFMPAFADDLAVTHHHATDPRIGVRGVVTFARQFQRARHEVGIEDGLLAGAGHSFTGSRARRSISSRNSLRSWKRLYTDAKRM